MFLEGVREGGIKRFICGPLVEDIQWLGYNGCLEELFVKIEGVGS